MSRCCNRAIVPRCCGLLALVAAAAAVGGCRGYTARPLFRPDIRTVHLRVFDNRTFWRGYEVDLTRAIEDEIKLRTPLVFAGPGRADSVLSGDLVSLDLATHIKSEDDVVLISRVTGVVRFRWVDRLTGADIVPPQSVSDSVRVAWMTGEGANRLLFEELAMRVVDQMQEPW